MSEAKRDDFYRGKMPYEVKDISLAEQGMKQIEWAEMQMAGLMKIRACFKAEKPLKGIKIGMALHVTKETAVFRLLGAKPNRENIFLNPKNQ